MTPAKNISTIGQTKKSLTDEQDTQTGVENNNSSTSTGSSSAQTAKSNTSASSKSGQNKKNTSLKEIFEAELLDIYDAEKQLLQALPKLAKAADDEELQDAFNEHYEVTQRQVERLEKIFNRLHIEKKENVKCIAMQGLIEESEKIIKEYDQSPIRDTALIIGAQKVEHYEIAAYGSLCELADVLGLYKISDALDRSLAEEEDTDRYLTEIAYDVNDEAFEMSH